MSKKPTVFSALAAALALGAAEAQATLGPTEASTNNEALQSQAPVVSEAARAVVLQSAEKVVTQSKEPVRLIAFQLFENGPSFVQSRPK